MAQVVSRTHSVIPYNRSVIAPPGMVYIPGGSTVIKYDQSSTDSNSSRLVSLTSFFIDKTEITNDEYRMFTEWVIDSIAIVKYLKDDKYFIEDDKDSAIAPVASVNNNVSPVTTIDTNAAAPKVIDTSATAMMAKPVDTNAMKQMADTSGPVVTKRINWSRVHHDKIWDTKNAETRGKLQPMLDENGNIKKECYNFTMTYLKVVSTDSKAGKKATKKKEMLNIYPDETCWATDLTNSQTDMYVENYFKAPPFDDYPVVGVTWSQARAYSYWRSLNAAAYYEMPDYMQYYSLTYTLPSEAQWVYAAQGYYDMIVPADSTENDTLNNIAFPTDSTVTPHDTAWVNAQMRKYSPDSANQANPAGTVNGDSVAKVQSASDERRAAREARVAKKRADQRFNYYLADFLMKGKYGGRYSNNPNGRDRDNGGATADIDPNVPVLDSSAVHFDPNGMLTNFKQDEGDYWEDGSALTLPVMSYAPNEFGLYNMEGNVSEWTIDAYSPSTFSFVSDLNPALLYDADSTDADAMKRKVVRGGSFMSNSKSLNPYYRDMELQNISHCFIGFRCVMQAPEVLTKNVATRNKTIRGNKVKGRFSEPHFNELH